MPMSEILHQELVEMTEHNSYESPSPLAEKHSLDLPHAVSIEFPAKVRNIPKALSLVGGIDTLASCVDKQEPLQLRFRPRDAFEHPISSRTTKHQNILLKVDIPKKFLEQANGDIRLAIKLSNGEFSAKPHQILDTNFRFREMADFQRNTLKSDFLAKVRPSIFSGSLKAIKSLDVQSSGASGSQQGELDIIPPPKFSQIVFPFQYGYRQNPAVSVLSNEDGTSSLVHTSVTRKLYSIMIGWDEVAPTKPPDSLPSSPDSNVSACIERVRELFDQRPMWTRRGVESNIDPQLLGELKYALPYVAYFFKSGPYRSAYAKYGVDPRLSPEYAIYQTEHYRILDKPGTADNKMQQATPDQSSIADVSGNLGNNENGSSDVASYKFDGIHLMGSRVIQLCDITDPQVLPLLSSAQLRESIDKQYDGWYAASDIDLIRRVLRAKLLAIRQGKVIDDNFIEQVRNEKKTKQKASSSSKEAKEVLLERVSHHSNTTSTVEFRAMIDQLEEEEARSASEDQEDDIDDQDHLSENEFEDEHESE